VKLLNVHVSEFLDKTDRSLAFAVFGAAQYNSFPVTVLPVSSDELLLCFDGLFTLFICSQLCDLRVGAILHDPELAGSCRHSIMWAVGHTSPTYCHYLLNV